MFHDPLVPYRGLFTPPTPGDSGITLTSFGTTTMLLDDGKTQLLFDALLTRPSLPRVLLCPLQTNEALADQILDKFYVNHLAAIFCSHSHYDHVLDAAYLAKKTGAVLYGSRSTLNVGRGGDLPEEQLRRFEPNRAEGIGKFSVTPLRSCHSKPNAFNDDLGVPITQPLRQPARKRAYTEGGSYDFLVAHGKTRILIRPSYNFSPGALKGVTAETLLLGVGGMGNETYSRMDRFYAETVERVQPNTIIPVHWDNFFLPLRRPLRAQMSLADNLPRALDYLARRTSADGIRLQMLDVFDSIAL